MRSTYLFVGTLTANQPLATCSKDLKDESERRFGKGSPIPVPSIQGKDGTRLMFPATGIRGKLRRACRDVFREALIQNTGNSNPLTLDQHYLLSVGGIKDSSDEDKSTVALEADYRQKNPLISLFGAGAAGNLGFVNGRLQVSNAICQEPSAPIHFSGARTDDLYRDPDQIRFLSDGDVDDLIQRAKGNREASKIRGEIKLQEKLVKDLKRKGASDELSSASTTLERLKESLSNTLSKSGASSVSLGMPLSGWHAIAPDSVMNHQMTLALGTLIELGAILATLEQFSISPVLGAHYALGCGQVEGSWEVYKVARGGKQMLGSVSFKAYDGVLTIDASPGSELHQALNAFNEFLKRGDFDLSIPGAA